MTANLQHEISDRLQIKLRRIHALDETLANLLFMTKNGCVLVAGPETATSVAAVADFFLRHSVWLPIVCYAPGSTGHCPGAFSVISDLNALAPHVRAALRCDLSGTAPPAEFRHSMRQLTPREREVINHFLSGQNTKYVAKSLGITYQTVDKHRGRALRKFGAKTIVHLQITLQRTLLASMGIGLDHHRGVINERTTDEQNSAPQTLVPSPHFQPVSSLVNR